MTKTDDLERTNVTFVTDVKTFRAEINQILDSLEQSILKQAHTARHQDTQSTESVSTTCAAMLADLEAMSMNIETHNKYKQQRQLVISLKKFKIKSNNMTVEREG